MLQPDKDNSTEIMSPTANASHVAEAKVLVVGAGGIGCELLKNLALSGFKSIEVVDLDVIELSNLNRQFLFRKHHIGRSKAQVAAEAVKKLISDCGIVPHFANIKDTSLFPISFFRKFSLVLNALDNLDARRHVNNMCLAVKVPLVESGTAGYLGQVSVILPGLTECFDCTPKDPPTTFPICTIRTTPSAPIHCIVWAKEFLLGNLFAKPAEESYPSDADEEVIASLRREVAAFDKLRALAIKRDPSYASRVFDKVFNQDIRALCELSDLWQFQDPPQPLEQSLEDLKIDDLETLDKHQVWSLSEWIGGWKASVESLAERAFPDSTNESLVNEIFFDKDDDKVMSFVASSANIRAHIFGLPTLSLFTIMSMAGNIVPAIATTNAVVAGKITLQALNFLNNEKLCNSFVTYGTRRGALFARESPSPPSVKCSVCFVDRAVVNIDTRFITVTQLVNFASPLYSKCIDKPLDEDVVVVEGSRLVYDYDETKFADKTLLEAGCGDSKFVRLDFFGHKIPLIVAICHAEGILSFEFNLLSAEQRAAFDSAVNEEEEEPVKKATKFDTILIDDDILIL